MKTYHYYLYKKKALYRECHCIEHESTNWRHYISISYWRRDHHCTWSLKPCKGLAVICKAKAVSSFLSYFKALIIGPAPDIEPVTSRSAVKCSNDLANPAVVGLRSNYIIFICY